MITRPRLRKYMPLPLWRRRAAGPARSAAPDDWTPCGQRNAAPRVEGARRLKASNPRLPTAGIMESGQLADPQPGPASPRLTEPAAAAHPPGALPPRHCSEGPRYATRLAHARTMARGRCPRQSPLRAYAAADALPSLRPGRPVDHAAGRGSRRRCRHRSRAAAPRTARCPPCRPAAVPARLPPSGRTARSDRSGPASGRGKASLALANPQPVRGMIGHGKRFEGTCPENNMQRKDEKRISGTLRAILPGSRPKACQDAGKTARRPFRAPRGHFCLALPFARARTPPNCSITPVRRSSGNPR